jgi:hypothetical protein
VNGQGSGQGSGWWQSTWKSGGLLPDAESFGQDDGLGEPSGSPEQVAEALLRRES